MSECPFQSRLSAYHDRELDLETSRKLESHLAACSSCGETLVAIRAVSRLLNGTEGGRMSQMGMARLHAVADDAAAKHRRDVFPMFKTLLAVAASVLVVAGAWLSELPTHHPGHNETSRKVAPEADWEKVAGGGKLQLPRDIASPTDVAGADSPSLNDFSDFMLKGLGKTKESGS